MVCQYVTGYTCTNDESDLPVIDSRVFRGITHPAYRIMNICGSFWAFFFIVLFVVLFVLVGSNVWLFAAAAIFGVVFLLIFVLFCANRTAVRKFLADPANAGEVFEQPHLCGCCPIVWTIDPRVPDPWAYKANHEDFFCNPLKVQLKAGPGTSAAPAEAGLPKEASAPPVEEVRPAKSIEAWPAPPAEECPAEPEEFEPWVVHPPPPPKSDEDGENGVVVIRVIQEPNLKVESLE